MADRTVSGANGPGGPIERSIAGLANAVNALSARLRGIESSRNQWAPADCRFERRIDPDTDELYVDVVRVSTGNRQQIAGPL